MENKDTSHEPQIKPTLLRESEFFGGCIRVKISVKNTSSLAILDAALELESDEKILHFDRCEPEYPEKKGKILLGNINPNTDRTIAFYLDPLICAKEGTDVNCRVSYKDAFGRPDSVQMEPLKIKVICPIFRTEQDVNIGRLKELVSGLQFHDSKVYTIPRKVEISELLGTCRNVIQLHDVRHIKTFKTTDEKTYEAWYYGKTKVTKKDLVIKCAICKDTESIEVLASGNDPADITGLLAEIGRNLTREFERLGKVQPVFNIHIKDSIIQRSNLLSFCNMDGTCGGDVVIEDSVVQRSNIASRNEAAQKERGEAQKREKDEQERLRRLKEQEDRALRERKAREEAERRESERLKARQKEERIAKEREELSVSEKEKGFSQIKFLAVALVLGVLLLGYWALAPGSTNESEIVKSIPTPVPTLASNEKYLLVGETWGMGGGLVLTVQSVDAKASPRQVWFTLSKDGIKLNDVILSEGQTYTYEDIFSTKIDKIDSGATSDGVYFTNIYITSAPNPVAIVTPTSTSKILVLGETWDIGGSLTLTVWSIDATASPRQVRLVLSKNGIKLEEPILLAGQTYTYKNIFSTKIDKIFSGPATDFVVLTNILIPIDPDAPRS